MDRIVILSAGASTRFWPLASIHHKAFYRIGTGKTILEETVSGILEEFENPTEISIVVAPRDFDLAVRLFNDNDKVKVYVQEKPTGAGQGLLKALKGDFSGKFMLTTGDKINAGKILKELAGEDLAHSAGSGQAVALRKTKDPKHYGIVELEGDRIKSVTEKPDEGSSPSDSKITSAYLLDSSFLTFVEKHPSDHYSLEIALDEYVRENDVKGVFVDEIEDTRLKFPWDLLDINQKIQSRKSMQFIDPSAQISKTSVIDGPVYIDKNARVLDFVKIVGPAYIGENALIGDFCLIRKNSYIDKNVTIGSYSEIKNSLIYEGTTVHRNYIGDSVMDENSKIGAGTILANRRNDRGEIKSMIKGELISSGLDFLGAFIGAGAKTGANSAIMPGRKIGKNANIWPGKVVLEDVPEEETLK
ncbi:MAG: hypothetical protein ACD_37C00536G0002 [uncultured bacterium]|nr:MAG: hypothetical protein ACD_37C00536G0002 [uncultured bacterium]